MRSVLVLLAIALPPKALAGSCLGEQSDYLRQIEKRGDAFKEEGKDQEDPLACLVLAYNYLELGRENLIAGKALESERGRRSSDKALAGKVLAPLLTSSDQRTKCDAALALALYQDELAFQGLAVCPNDCTKALAFAVLGDGRAEGYLLDRYRALDKRRRQVPLYAEKICILAALSRLGGPAARRFVEERQKHPRPKNLEPHIAKALGRWEDKR